MTRLRIIGIILDLQWAIQYRCHQSDSLTPKWIVWKALLCLLQYTRFSFITILQPLRNLDSYIITDLLRNARNGLIIAWYMFACANRSQLGPPPVAVPLSPVTFFPVFPWIFGDFLHPQELAPNKKSRLQNGNGGIVAQHNGHEVLESCWKVDLHLSGKVDVGRTEKYWAHDEIVCPKDIKRPRDDDHCICKYGSILPCVNSHLDFSMNPEQNNASSPKPPTPPLPT